MTSKDLEETIKEKVSPLLEESMEKHWGITIPQIESDISDKLKSPQLNVYVPANYNFSKAKKFFKKEFFKKEIKLHQGNISELSKFLGIDRRSIHRTIKELNIDVDKLRGDIKSKEEYKQDAVDKAIRSTLDQYKEIIQPQKMEKMYQEVSSLSRNIAKFLPLEELSWKDAEREFERQFFTQTLKDNDWNVAKTAKKIEIRTETLHRKIKKLAIHE
jgi:DNA-binding NtrC family response regulator